jgi:hypothetical protein
MPIDVATLQSEGRPRQPAVRLEGALTNPDWRWRSSAAPRSSSACRRRDERRHKAAAVAMRFPMPHLGDARAVRPRCTIPLRSRAAV